jgi:hypothetical protein
MAKPTPEYVIYDRQSDKFVSPICSSVEDLKEHLRGLDEDANDDDYQIMTVTRTVELRLVKNGWTIDRV